MIIIMAVNLKNKQIAQKLVEQYTAPIAYYPVNVEFSKNPILDRIALLDFTYDGTIPLPQASDVAKYFIKKGLPENIKFIDLMIPNTQDKLILFAEELADAFKDQYGRNIAIRCYINIQYDYTFLVPPNDQYPKWRIYGVYEKDRTNKQQSLSIENIDSVNQKTLLWEGSDISQYFNTSARIYSAREETQHHQEAKSKFFTVSSDTPNSLANTNKRHAKNGLHENDKRLAKKHFPDQTNHLKPQ